MEEEQEYGGLTISNSVVDALSSEEDNDATGAATVAVGGTSRERRRPGVLVDHSAATDVEAEAEAAAAQDDDDDDDDDDAETRRQAAYVHALAHQVDASCSLLRAVAIGSPLVLCACVAFFASFVAYSLLFLQPAENMLCGTG